MISSVEPKVESDIPKKQESAPSEWMVIYFGRMVVYLVVQCLSFLGLLASKVSNVAFNTFSSLGTQDKEPGKFTAQKLDESSTFSTSSEVTAESDSEATESDSDQHQPFSAWVREDWDLVSTVFETMHARLSKPAGEKDLSESSEGFQKELKSFREFHEKLLRFWKRNDIPKEIESFRKVFEKYLELTGIPGTIFQSTMEDANKINPNPMQNGVSPRIALGGIPQMSNNCYLNACVQVIHANHFTPLSPPANEEDVAENTEFKKKLQLDHALRLLQRVKDEPNAGADEVWIAAFVLRNLLFDLKLIPDFKTELTYFRQQDAVTCAEGLIQTDKIEIKKVFKIKGQEEVIPDFNPSIKEAVIKLVLALPETLGFQALVNKKFSEYEDTQVEESKGRSFNKVPLENGEFRWEARTDSPFEVTLPTSDFKIREFIKVPKDENGIDIFPRFLCLSVGRFYNEKQFCFKNESRIDFPQNGIVEFSKAFDGLAAEGSVQYKLTGTVLHGGTVGGGHYTAFATRDNGETWRLYNDGSISSAYIQENGNIPADVLEAIEKQGYIFYLEKI